MTDEQLTEIIEGLLETILDAIEQTVGMFSKPSPKYLREMLLVIVLLTVLSRLLEYFGFPVFMSVYEGITAVVILGVFLVISYVNKVGINDIKKSLERRIKK